VPLTLIYSFAPTGTNGSSFFDFQKYLLIRIAETGYVIATVELIKKDAFINKAAKTAGATIPCMNRTVFIALPGLSFY
jgi:hypothetical protein